MAEQDLNAFANAYSNLGKLNQYDAQQTAGNALAKGDFAGATNTLYRAGDIGGGQQVQQYSVTQRKQHAEAAQRISQGIRAAVNAGHTPAEAYDMATQIAPQLGVDPVDLQKMRPAFDKDPRAFLDMVDQQAKRELEIVNRGNGGYDVVDKNTGAIVRGVAPTEKPLELDPSKNYVVPNGPSSAQPAPAAAPAGNGQPIATARPDADAVFNAIIAQESGGRPGVSGPKTQYGVAQGIGQLLPQTAQAMAQKLGVVWRPDLMTAKTPEAQQYQTQLSRAYFDQAWQAGGGDPAQAAKYYYGGPNQKIWGPKTQAYAQAILQRVGGQNAMQGGAGGDNLSPEIPGYRYIQRAQATADDSALDPQTVDLLAGRYLKDGTLPALGMGKAAAANRSAILKAASAKAKELGINADDLVAGTVSVKAGTSALQKVAGTTELIRASEQTVEKNLKIALDLAQRVNGPTGVPVLNRWIQAGRKNIAGDADVAALNQAVGTVADEYAKVMTTTNGAGAGMTSDSARQEAYRRINSAMTPQQLQAVIGVMRQEMQNRLASYQETQTGILNAIRGTNSANPQAAGASPPAQASASAAPASQPRIRRYNPATGRLE